MFSLCTETICDVNIYRRNFLPKCCIFPKEKFRVKLVSPSALPWKMRWTGDPIPVVWNGIPSKITRMHRGGGWVLGWKLCTTHSLPYRGVSVHGGLCEQNDRTFVPKYVPYPKLCPLRAVKMDNFSKWANSLPPFEGTPTPLEMQKWTLGFQCVNTTCVPEGYCLVLSLSKSVSAWGWGCSRVDENCVDHFKKTP